ncbi:hypothetical protein RSOLAG1IB_04471 [Rhizoctonia solani AG-1 IB]|uniref:Uncharacterized protein n=1 Tax=Thanatephorus cucumeris (strain AG1-IB / isolate 7/3/14) TaxID=1108050 RepID=A0A0B7FUT7_THACB|nr:hypothetical protein RSOLAG1IB_04471 [Rhizoctonia solani AG-1 IB]
MYRSQGKLATLHRSLDHEQPSMTINFQGSAIWLYGPPRNQLQAVPVDHKICLYETHPMVSDTICFRVDVAEAYSFADDFDAPVVIFAKGGLSDHQHRIVVSVADPVDELDRHRGIQFSHAVHTIERPTPWPVEEDKWRLREVIMHDTHPLLSYWPRAPVSSSWPWWPWSSEISGWFNKTYKAEDGSLVSWHELQSRDEVNQSEWGLDATITAGVVAIYGIPKAYITGNFHLSNICVRIDSGPCEVVDVQHAYLNTEHHSEAVLLWRNEALDPYEQTHISVQLIQRGESGSLKVFPFKAIRYWEQQEYSSPDPPVGRVENVTTAHDHRAIVYHPGRRCVRHFAWWCTKWFDPWSWKEVGPSGSVLTYRSTVSSYRTSEDPSITLDFKGSAVYVYGAPKLSMRDGFASQHICLNDLCHIVDLEQAYLNAPEAPFESTSIHSLDSLDGTSNVTMLSAIHPELDPVLIWSTTGLDDTVQHSLRLALATLPSGENAEMTIAKVVYTQVAYDSGISRPEIPLPQPDHSYGGPLYPPHAIKWAPRLPSPPSPPSPQLPFPPAHPPHQPPSDYKSSIWPFIFWPLIGAMALLSLCCCCVQSRGDLAKVPERRRIRPESPPPPYVFHPPTITPRTTAPSLPCSWPHSTHNTHSESTVKAKLLPPEPSTHQHSNSIPTGPSSSCTGSQSAPSKSVPKTNPESSGLQRPPTPGSSTGPESAKQSLEDRNNVGPCPGLNAAPQRPGYTDSVQTQSTVSSQKKPTFIRQCSKPKAKCYGSFNFIST